MKKLLLFACSFLLCCSVFGQCPTGNLWVDQQSVIDDFLAQHPNCNKIDGSLIITDYFGVPLNLQGLEVIEEVTGDMLVSPFTLPNLDCIENIRHIGGDLVFSTVTDFVEVEDLSAFENLKTIEGNIRIGGKASLGDVIGLNNLEKLGGFHFESSRQTGANIVGFNQIDTLKNGIVAAFGSSNYAPISIGGLNNVIHLGKLVLTSNSTVDISGLYNLKSIKEELEIYGVEHGQYNSISDRVPNIVGIENLNQISEIDYIRLEFSTNNTSLLPSLNKTNGLSLVVRADSIDICPLTADSLFVGRLHFEGNYLSGLNEIKKINSSVDVRVRSNGSIDVFKNTVNIQGGLTIDYSIFPTSTNILNRLESIGGDFKIRTNDNLQSFSLPSLSSIGGNFEINLNEDLTNLDFLSNLQSINGYLDIYDNPNLTRLTGLRNLDASTINSDTHWFDLRIENNPMLSFCAVESMCDALADPFKTTEMQNNAVGCRIPQEVLDNCADGQVRGVVFFDENCNGIRDNGEETIANHLIVDEDGLPITATSKNGTFEFFHDGSSDSFAARSVDGFINTPDFISLSSPSQDLQNVELGLCPTDNFVDLESTITAYYPPRPGFETTIQVCVKNNGSLVEDAEIKTAFAKGYDLVEYTAIEGGLFLGDTAVWQTYNLEPFEQRCFYFWIEGSTAAMIDDEIQAITNVQPFQSVPESDLQNNLDTLNEVFVSSYDPNDKLVDRPIIEYKNDGERYWLDYTIRFQNTGNAPAETVVVRDNLERLLDPKTIKMVSASHDYQLDFDNANQLVWTFEDIDLADLLSNESESHGFIRFQVETEQIDDISETIDNRCGIYFDFNDPIITDWAITQFEMTSSIGEFTEKVKPLIFPNPTRSDLFVQLPIGSKIEHLEIIDLNGKSFPMSVHNANESIVQLSTVHLPKGVYFLRVTSLQKAYSSPFIKN